MPAPGHHDRGPNLTGSRVVVVGASTGGLRAAEQLRAAGWSGALTVIGDEPHMPYNRPPLSEDALAGDHAHAEVAFRPRASCADVDGRLGRRAVGVDLRERRIRLADGESLSYAGWWWPPAGDRAFARRRGDRGGAGRAGDLPGREVPPGTGRPIAPVRASPGGAVV